MSNKENETTQLGNVQVGEKKGLLSPIGDPVGKVLGTAVTPVGNVVGGVTKPVTDLVGGSEEASKKGDDSGSIGGKEQTGQNPLGL